MVLDILIYKMIKTSSKIVQEKKYILSISAVILVVIFSHAFNMFGYPYYENDEGIYMSQAWSVATQGKLSPYTYWYDHAPAGWLLIALWSKLSGGFNTFGLAVNSGRVLMLLLHLAIAYFIYQISKKYTNNIWTGLLAVLVFALSPLAIYYQRRVLLDNIMVFWLLWSLVILLKNKLSSWQYYLSAVIFALAVLTKESAVIFYPAILYLIMLRYPWRKNKGKLFSWLVVSLIVISFYPFYAWTQGELWVNDLATASQHISLLETLKLQATRGNGLPFWNKNSDFGLVWQDWLFRDPFLTIGGLVVSLIIILSSFFKKGWRVISLGLIGYIIFLLRGKVVLHFYIIPLIPFVVIGLALLFNEFSQWFQKKKIGRQSWWLSLLVIIILWPIVGHSTDQYKKQDTKPQKEVVEWIKNNLPADSKIAIDDYAYVDYHSPKSVNNKIFKNAHVFWKIETDDKIKQDIFHNNWFQIQYIAGSNVLEDLLKNGQLNLVRRAYKHSEPIKEWRSEDSPWAYKTSVRKIKNGATTKKTFIIKDQTKKDASIDKQLEESWRSYKEKFIHNYGQVIDPINGVTTSEGQSYAMLRAVWMNDEDTFRGVWQWAKDHFQFRNEDKLFSWKWQGNKLVDFNNATDADEDIALALILAHKKWNKEEYILAGRELLKSIWEECVAEINNRYYLLPVNHNIATQWNGYLFNPSYLSPAWYRVFAEVDSEHNWNKLADDSYLTLADINNLPNNKIKMPANWYIVENATGKLLSAKELQGKESEYFGFDAFRTFWRVALDEQWYKSQDANNYLRQAGRFASSYYFRNNALPMLVKPNGQVINPKPSIAVNAGYLAIFMGLDNDNKVLMDKFYQDQIQSTYKTKGAYWQNPDDYYGNNWAWFATALYNGNLKK